MTALLALLLAGCSEPPAPEPVTYTVIKGDTLGRIARKYGTTVEQLRADNHIQGDLIEVGQVLVVGQGSQGSPLAPRTDEKRAVTGAQTLGPAAEGLILPPEQPCLDPPSDTVGDDGMAASQGLDAEQVKGAIDGFIHHALPCTTDLAAEGTLGTRITVACTGRVSSVQVVSARGLSEDAVACVTEVLRYVPFPAHDLPDGETFDQPITLSPP